LNDIITSLHYVLTDLSFSFVSVFFPFPNPFLITIFPIFILFCVFITRAFLAFNLLALSIFFVILFPYSIYLLILFSSVSILLIFFAFSTVILLPFSLFLHKSFSIALAIRLAYSIVIFSIYLIFKLTFSSNKYCH